MEEAAQRQAAGVEEQRWRVLDGGKERRACEKDRKAFAEGKNSSSSSGSINSSSSSSSIPDVSGGPDRGSPWTDVEKEE